MSVKEEPERKWVEVRELTNYQIAPDGSSVLLNLIDSEGHTGVIVPLEQLKELALSMPQIAEQAFQTANGVPSLRLVHELDEWQLEKASQDGVAILSMKIRGGFSISVAISLRDLRDVGEAASGEQSRETRSVTH